MKLTTFGMGKKMAGGMVDVRIEVMKMPSAPGSYKNARGVLKREEWQAE